MNLIGLTDTADDFDLDHRAERNGVIESASVTVETFGAVLVFAEHRCVCLESEFDFLESTHLFDGDERVGVVATADLLLGDHAGHRDRSAAEHEHDEDQDENSDENQSGDRAHKHGFLQ